MPRTDDPLTREQSLEEQLPPPLPEKLALLLDPEKLIKLQIRLIDLAHDAILIRDPDSRIVAWNQGAQALYGWSDQEAIGHSKLQLLHTPPELLKVIDQALNETGFWEGLLQHTTSHGQQVMVESRQVLVRDEAGHPTAILEINRDVTLRERLLHERAEAQARELALQETIRQMDEFLSLVSHELRTPVTSLKSMVQLMLRHATRDADEGSGTAQTAQKQSDLLRRAERQTNRLVRLLDDLLDLSRIREGKMELHLEPDDLRYLVEEIIENEAIAHPGRQIMLELPSEQPLLVMADADRIGQVITNYLTNALKYSPATQPVQVCLRRTGTYARVEVQDHGPGIPFEEQAHIWEMFQRAPGIEVVSGSGVGLGLGLYLSKTLIERHGGQVGVESTPGQGALFWFTLPLADDQAPA
ncbi:MAG TPA: PAS domain-containing sensor histidine kinase [Ktedonobacterales bacterium]|nr:PAS domain-containing sensor histidine kinase [Ktedonobacterales bacterium]